MSKNMLNIFNIEINKLIHLYSQYQYKVYQTAIFSNSEVKIDTDVTDDWFIFKNYILNIRKKVVKNEYTLYFDFLELKNECNILNIKSIFYFKIKNTQLELLDMVSLHDYINKIKKNKEDVGKLTDMLNLGGSVLSDYYYEKIKTNIYKKYISYLRKEKIKKILL